ncbi:hypothetical protein GCM10027089_23320 [Nocardia thraciensis]
MVKAKRSVGAVVLWCAIGLVAGVVPLGYGIHGLVTSGKVTCDNRVMKPGDTCTTKKRKRGMTTRSYQEQKKRDRNSALIALGIGSVVTLGVGTLLVVGLRRPDENPQP